MKAGIFSCRTVPQPGKRQSRSIPRPDADRLPDYEKALERAAGLLRDMATRTPPNAGGGWLELLRNAGLGGRFAGLDLEDKRLLLDLFTKSAADYLAGWFESDVVIGAFAFDGIVGAYAAPSTPGTASVLLHHCSGEVRGRSGDWGHAMGGMGSVSRSIAAAAREAGAEIRTGAKVKAIAVAGGRAVGVEISSGEFIKARAVASDVGPKLLFRDLVPIGSVDQSIARRFVGLKSDSGTFRMNVALSDLPNFTCRPSGGGLAGDYHGAGIIIGPTLEYLERAYLDARDEGWSRQPVIEMLIPSTVDQTLAPEGQHVASLFIKHVAPQFPSGRSWSDPSERVAFADFAIETVSSYAPNFKASVLARQLHSPLDLEDKFGLVDGDIFHGQMNLDQIFSARPVLGYGDYRMPLEGLYLCGAGAHPGGGVTGLPGRSAAREIQKDLDGGLFGFRRVAKWKSTR